MTCPVNVSLSGGYPDGRTRRRGMKCISEGGEGREHNAFATEREDGWSTSLLVDLEAMHVWQKLDSALGSLVNQDLPGATAGDVLTNINGVADLNGSQPDCILQCLTRTLSFLERFVAPPTEHHLLSLTKGNLARMSPKRHTSNRCCKIDLYLLLIAAEALPDEDPQPEPEYHRILSSS